MQLQSGDPPPGKNQTFVGEENNSKSLVNIRAISHVLNGGGEYIKEIKTNPRFYNYSSVFLKPQSFFD